MARTLQVEIIGNAESLEKAFRKSQQAGESFSSHVQGRVHRSLEGLRDVTRTVALGFLGGGAAIGLEGAIHTSIERMHDLEEANVRTEQALKTTKGVSGQTAESIRDYALELQNTTGVSRVAVQESENLLLAFTRVRGEGFQRATRDALDLSKAFGISLPSATKLLGKALQDPVAGMNGLRRAGIVLTAEQKDQIKTFMEHGEVAKAQGVIFSQLEERVGGTAQAMGKTLPGQIAIAEQRLSDLGANIATKLLPAFSAAVGWVNAHWSQISAVIGAVSRAVQVVFDSALIPATKRVIQWVSVVVDRVRQDWPQIRSTVSSVIGTVRSIIDGFVTVATALWRRFGSTIVSIVRTDFNTVVSVARGMYQAVSGVFQLVGDLIHGRWSEIWGDVKKIVKGSLDAVVALIRGFVSTAAQAAYAVGKAIMQGIESGIMSLAGAIADRAKSVVHGIVGAMKSVAKIFSPSRLTHDEIGVPLAQGIAQGFAEYMSGAGSDVVTAALTSMLVKAQKKAKSYVGSTEFSTADGTPLGDWWVQQQEQASQDANPNAAGSNGSLFTYMGPTIPDQYPGQSSSAPTVEVHFNAPVLGDKQKVADELVDAIHAALLRKQNRGLTLGFS